MLVRVRDEVRMFKHALQSLYDSSIAYGLKKALNADLSTNAMNQKIKDLVKENKELTRKIDDLEETIRRKTKLYHEEDINLAEDHEDWKKDQRIKIFKIQ